MESNEIFDEEFLESSMIIDDKDEKIKMIKGVLTSTKSKISQKVNKLAKAKYKFGNEELKIFLKTLNELKIKLNRDYDELFGMLPCSIGYSDSKFRKECEISEIYEEKLNKAISKLESKLMVGQDPVGVNPSQRENSANLRLPTLNLPEWDGDILTYGEFINNFEFTFLNDKYSSKERFLYLLNCVKGKPNSMLQKLPFEQQFYEEAKSLLDKAYCNPTEKKFALLNKLFNLKFNWDEDFTDWYSTVAGLDNLYDNLNIDKDCIFQYMLWKSLPGRIQNDYVSLLGKTLPTKKEILDNYFDIIKRIKSNSNELNLQKGLKLGFNKNRNNFYDKQSKPWSNDRSQCKAAKLELTTSDRICRLCRPLKEAGQNISNHSIFGCDRFCTSSQKINRLRELGMCTRCASASCSYFKNKQKCLVELKFKCNCGGDHLNFLCQKLDTKKGTVSSSPNGALYGNKMDKGKKTNVNVSQSKNFSINMGNKIAPPFCKLVCLRDNEPWEISTLIDTGSQYTFVSQEVLKFADYTFMEDVNLELSGINNSKIYRTIEILLKIVINNEIRPLLCTVLPELESTYELPGKGS